MRRRIGVEYKDYNQYIEHQKEKTTTLVLSSLKRLVGDTEFRHQLYRRTTAFNFSGNKRKIVKAILQLRQQ